MTLKDFRNALRELIKKELQEASVTGNIDGGAGPPKTPHAFRKKKSKKIKKAGHEEGHKKPDVFGFTKVNEAKFHVKTVFGSVLIDASGRGEAIMKVAKVLKGGRSQVISAKRVGVSKAKQVDKKLESVNEDAKATANQIKSASRYGEKGVYPLNKVYRDLKSDIKSGAGKSELLARFKKSALIPQSYYVYTNELAGFVVFGDGAVFHLVSDQGGDVKVTKSKNWKSDIRKESVNEGKYHDYKNDDSLTAKQKIGKSVREVRGKLDELDKLVKLNVKLKNELEVDSRSYWKRTHTALKKISERLVKLSNKIGQLY